MARNGRIHGRCYYYCGRVCGGRRDPQPDRSMDGAARRTGRPRSVAESKGDRDPSTCCCQLGMEKLSANLPVYSTWRVDFPLASQEIAFMQ